MSEALKFWQDSWNGSKSEKTFPQRNVADNAISQMMRLEARIGRKEELEKQFAELGTRPFRGASASRMYGVKGGLYEMQHSPSTAYKCGPLAIDSILFAKKPAKGYDPILKAACSTAQGTNLSQVKDWADKVGLKMQMARRNAGAELIYPAVVHLTIVMTTIAVLRNSKTVTESAACAM